MREGFGSGCCKEVLCLTLVWLYVELVSRRGGHSGLFEHLVVAWTQIPGTFLGLLVSACKGRKYNRLLMPAAALCSAFWQEDKLSWSGQTFSSPEVVITMG